MSQKRRHVSPEIDEFRHRLDPCVSLDRLWYELNTRAGGAASSTIEALVFSLRAGVDALARPENLRRLAELNDDQMLDVAVRLQKFAPHIASAWTARDIEVLAAVWSRL